MRWGFEELRMVNEWSMAAIERDRSENGIVQLNELRDLDDVHRGQASGQRESCQTSCKWGLSAMMAAGNRLSGAVKLGAIRFPLQLLDSLKGQVDPLIAAACGQMQFVALNGSSKLQRLAEGPLHERLSAPSSP